MKKYEKYFEFPQGILNQISECSPEGYLLFYIDNYGKPQLKADFTHEITELGLRAHATRILNSISEVEGSSITDSIFRNMQDDGEENEN